MKKCELEGCNKKARRRFCSNKHKDKYHNRHNPRGFYKHLNKASRDWDPENDFHPHDTYSLGQE